MNLKKSIDRDYASSKIAGKEVLIPSHLFKSFVDFNCPKVTIFCAVWSGDNKRMELLDGHSNCLMNQDSSPFPFYIFDNNDIPENFILPHIVCKQPLTVYEAWNIATILAPTEYVMNLNLDDRIFNNAVSVLKGCLDKSDADLVGGEWLIDFEQPLPDVEHLKLETQKTVFIPNWPPVKTPNLRLGSGTNERGTFGPSTMWKKSRTGFGYPNIFSNGEKIKSIGDVLFWHVLEKRGRKLIRTPEIIGIYHSDASSQAEFRPNNDRENLKMGFQWHC